LGYADWHRLIQSIVEDPLYVDIRGNTADVFWSIALDNPFYDWTDLTKMKDE